MKEGIYLGKVHGYDTLIKIIKDKKYIAQRKGKKYSWRETIVDVDRFKKFKSINDAQMTVMIEGDKKTIKYKWD